VSRKILSSFPAIILTILGIMKEIGSVPEFVEAIVSKKGALLSSE
jgi:hypothetical protein